MARQHQLNIKLNLDEIISIRAAANDLYEGNLNMFVRRTVLDRAAEVHAAALKRANELPRIDDVQEEG